MLIRHGGHGLVGSNSKIPGQGKGVWKPKATTLTLSLDTHGGGGGQPSLGKPAQIRMRSAVTDGGLKDKCNTTSNIGVEIEGGLTHMNEYPATVRGRCWQYRLDVDRSKEDSLW